MDALHQLIDTYYRSMRAVDPSFHWSDPEWWRDRDVAHVVLTGKRDGFAIIGYGAQVDADVASEICELYCPDPFALLSLLRACRAHIRFPFGFQVLQANTRAQRCFEGLLERMRLGFTRTPAMDGSAAVLKYRLDQMPFP